MTAVFIWWRRSCAPFLAPFFVAACAGGALTQDGWQYEWLWGLRAVIVISFLLSPVVAAAVAFDIVQSWDGVLNEIAPSLPRRLIAFVLPAATHVVSAFLSVGVAWAAASVRLAAHDALWQADPTLPFEVLAAFSAAAAVGLAVATRLRTLGAVPLAAAAVFAGNILATGVLNVSTLFAVTGLRDSAVGLERAPVAALLAVAVNLALAAWLVTLSVSGSERTRSGGPLAAARRTLAGVPVLALLVLAGTWQPLEYRPVSAPTTCRTSSQVQVCGPSTAEPLVKDLAVDLSSARSRLASSGLDLPRRFVLGVPGVVPATGPGPTYAFVSPASLADDDRRVATLADVLSLPRVCPQLIEPDEDTTVLADDAAMVQEWLATALRSGGGVAPPRIREAYETLASCRVS